MFSTQLLTLNYLMLRGLNPSSRSLGLGLGWVTVLCSWAQHFTSSTNRPKQIVKEV